MKKFSFLFSLMVYSIIAFPSEIIQFKLSDGEVIPGRLVVPDSSKNIPELVIYVNGSGPNTYLNHRKIGKEELNYFDLFADEFAKRGIAFLSYSRRGVEISNKPPNYDSVVIEKYKKYLPSIEANDLAAIIKQLKKDKRLKNAKITLLGWSEGTILAAMVADQRKVHVDALILAGYAHLSMADVLKWQHSGAASINNISPYFDENKDRIITRAEYESPEARAAGFRKHAFKEAPFSQLDVNKDSLLTQEDFRLLSEGRLNAIFAAYEKNDDEWLWKNYFRVTSQWMKEHAELEPNKTRMLRLDIPIYIVQGEMDANCSVEWAYDLRNSFEQAGKKNLEVFVFKNHDHNLNYTAWAVKKNISEGIAKIFEIGEKIKGGDLMTH